MNHQFQKKLYFWNEIKMKDMDVASLNFGIICHRIRPNPSAKIHCELYISRQRMHRIIKNKLKIKPYKKQCHSKQRILNCLKRYKRMMHRHNLGSQKTTFPSNENLFATKGELDKQNTHNKLSDI